MNDEKWERKQMERYREENERQYKPLSKRNWLWLIVAYLAALIGAYALQTYGFPK